MQRFALTLEGPSGEAGIRGLRAILKQLLRRNGFRCIDAKEIPQQAECAPAALPAQKKDC
jgi:hypothetical protein